ncbi:hypothetical protein IAQ61_006954 [Plenodomus lingam]|uniref:uncharacterized protein n=1 Tax=Leptosphaeria maculans TaxID=5022 RepID=UPI00331BA88F|nr:hypothetical protein IAQ61_006954 [Plenodomus lingam]
MGFKSFCSWPKRRNNDYSSLTAYRGPIFASRPPHFKSLSLFLSSCTVTSTLGTKSEPRNLHFTCFLSEDPLTGIFSVDQDFHIPVSRRRKLAHRRYRHDNAIHRFLAQLMPWCDASIVVETRQGRWEYKVSRRSIKWCSWQYGVLLLDWQALYVDCYEQEQKRMKSIDRKMSVLGDLTVEGKWEADQQPGYMNI